MLYKNFMKTEKTYCVDCKANVKFSILGKVNQKIDMYYVKCPNGHTKEMYISKNLFEALKKYN